MIPKIYTAIDDESVTTDDTASVAAGTAAPAGTKVALIAVGSGSDVYGTLSPRAPVATAACDLFEEDTTYLVRASVGDIFAFLGVDDEVVVTITFLG